MPELKMLLMVFVMAFTTYLIRVLPMILFRKKITSVFINSLLFYIPYAVLSAMAFPSIFYSTGNIYTALVGTAVCIVSVVFKRSLITVALFTCLAVLIMNFIL